MEFTENFNILSVYTTTTIVTTVDLKKRQKVLERFLRISYQLYKLQNFNAVKAIWAGINATPAYRMKKTREEVFFFAFILPSLLSHLLSLLPLLPPPTSLLSSSS
jgi:hypothetical protein